MTQYTTRQNKHIHNTRTPWISRRCPFLVSRFSFLVFRFSFLVFRFSFLVSSFSFLVSRPSMLEPRFYTFAARGSCLDSGCSWLVSRVRFLLPRASYIHTHTRPRRFLHKTTQWLRITLPCNGCAIQTLAVGWGRSGAAANTFKTNPPP